jgi:DNA gyrase subunit A
VREHEDLVFISTNGMVQRTGVRGISRYGRLSQGVRVMNMKPEDTVSAVALIVESETDDPVALADAETLEGDHAPAPEESLDPDGAAAAESALGDGAGLPEPDEVDLDATDGPPTPES